MTFPHVTASRPRPASASAACFRSCRSVPTCRSQRTAGSCIRRRGVGWRRRAAILIGRKLDEIFPGHNIDPSQIVGDLSIARRQMVEIARAFSATDAPVQLVILDEPTSSLDSILAGQLLAFVRSFVAEGGAVILVSHLLNEILTTADRIVVMRDGGIVADRPGRDFSRVTLVESMGSVAREAVRREHRSVVASSERKVSAAPSEQRDSIALVANRGEMSAWQASAATARPTC